MAEGVAADVVVAADVEVAEGAVVAAKMDGNKKRLVSKDRCLVVVYVARCLPVRLSARRRVRVERPEDSGHYMAGICHA